MVKEVTNKFVNSLSKKTGFHSIQYLGHLVTEASFRITLTTIRHHVQGHACGSNDTKKRT